MPEKSEGRSENQILREKSEKLARRASILNIIGNSFLFMIKLTVGILFHSIAAISDAINNLSDIISSIAIFFCVKIGQKRKDDNHQFGHSRSEPIAAVVTALVMWILAYKIVESGIIRLINHESLTYNKLIVIVLGIGIIVKFVMFLYVRHAAKASKSPALRASYRDHINDIVITMIAIVGIFLAEFAGVYWFDVVAAFLIAGWIVYVGYKILTENLGLLMGEKPDEETIEKIRKEAMRISGVRGLNDVFAQYLGSKVQVEIHIEVDPALSVKEAHDIGNRVKNRIEDMHEINNAFVHIDVVEDMKEVKSDK